jgi:hypothetical protein
MRLLLNVARYAALIACVGGVIELLVVLVFFDSFGVVSRADLGQPPRPASDVLGPLLWTLGFGVLALGLHLLYAHRFRRGGLPRA